MRSNHGISDKGDGITPATTSITLGAHKVVMQADKARRCEAAVRELGFVVGGYEGKQGEAPDIANPNHRPATLLPTLGKF